MRKTHLAVRAAGGVVLLAALAASAPAPVVPATPLTKEEMSRVQNLHRHVLEVFIGRPGFGVGRLAPPPLEHDIVNPPRSASEPGGQQAVAPPQPFGKDKEHRPLQEASAKMFAPGPIYVDRKEKWVVREVRLIGLAKHPEPVVYTGDKLPAPAAQAVEAKAGAKAEKAAYKTRKLDAYESESVKRIEGGGGAQAEARGKTVRAVAGIYAGERCLKCHEHKGQLLGAFAYTLDKVALTPEEVKNLDAP